MGVPRPTPLEHLRLATRTVDLAWTLQHLHRTYGPIVDVGDRIPVRAVFVFGPEANRHVLADDPTNFRWRDAMRLLEVVDGPTALVLSDGEDRRRRRRLVQPAFSTRRVDAHLGLVVAEVDRALDRWTPVRRLVAHRELRPTIRRIVVRALFGEHLGALADEIGERLEPGLRYVQRTPLARLDIDTDAGPDTLSSLLATSLSDAELCDQIRSLIAAGYDTTSSAAAWTVHALGANRAAFDALRTQVRDTIGDRAPTVDDLRAMPFVDAVVRETLRLWPPGVVGGRTAVDDFELFGHRVRRGSTVLYSPYVTHRMTEVWGDDAAVRLAQRLRWTLHDPSPVGAGLATFTPRSGAPITVT